MRRNAYKWAVVGMLWFVCFFNYADRQAITAVFPKLKTEFGFDPVQLGLIGSAFMWVYAAGAPLAGFIADRFPRRHLILGGCVFWSAVTMLTGWCGAFWQFVTVRALEGFGETFYFPATMALLSDYHDRRTRSRALSLHQSSVYIGTILGSWLGGWFAERHGWRYGFYVFGGAGLCVALLLYRFLKEPPRAAAESEIGETAATSPAPVPPPGAGEVARLLLRRPTAILLMAAFLGANFVATIFLTWTPTFLVEKFGFPLAKAGLFGSLFIQLASAVSVPVGGVLSDLLTRRFAGGRMLVQASGLLIGASFVALVGITTDVRVLLGAMALFGLCKGLYDANIFASLFDVIEPRARATAAGLMNTIGWGGGALGPLAVGLATKYGHHAKDVDNMSDAIAFGAVIYVTGALLLLAAARYAARDRFSGPPALTPRPPLSLAREGEPLAGSSRASRQAALESRTRHPLSRKRERGTGGESRGAAEGRNYDAIAAGSIALTLLAPGLCRAATEAAEPIRIVGPEIARLDFTRTDGGLQPAPGLQTAVVFRADKEHPERSDGRGWTYHHHPDIACWKGRLYVGWDSCERDEDTWPSRELYSTSTDGTHWTAPAELFPQGVSTPLRMYFFHAPNGRMLAIAGLRKNRERTTEDTKGSLVVREIRADHTLGPVFTLRPPQTLVAGQAPVFGTAGDAGFVAACRELLANHLFLQQQDGGRLLAPSDRMTWLDPQQWGGDDRARQDAASFGKAMCFFRRADGALVAVMKKRWVTVSRDDGKNWSAPVRPSTLITNMGKVWGQKTPGGRYILAYNPHLMLRYPLAVAVSDDGVTFRDMRVVHGRLPTLRYPGRAKSPGASYGRGVSLWSSDGSRKDKGEWLVYSVNKEEIWVSHLSY